MRTVLFAMLSLSTFLVAQDARIEEVGKSPVEVKFASGGKVRMDLCSSGVELVGKDEGMLRVSYDRDAGVKIRFQVFGDHADLRVSGCPGNNFRVTVEVPKSSGLYVRMFAGELKIQGVTGDKDVELHAGQLTVDVSAPDDYAHVDASVTSGDLEASAFNVSKGGLFRSFDRTGRGKYRLHAHVGAGELDLR